MAAEEINPEDELPPAARAVAIFMVILISISSVSLFVLYSTMRSRSIGIATGYLKAIEYVYQSGELSFEKDLPVQSFETGIYKVNVNSVKSQATSNAIIVRIEIKDKFFSVTHYSEELKLIPMYQEESQ